MRFELSLVRSGVIDADSFCQALENQLAERLPMGQIAIEEGCLTARQVRDVLQQQRECDTKRFGEVAWELGLLTREQIASLLMAQSERQRPLAEYLIDLGVITAEQIEQEHKAPRGWDWIEADEFVSEPPAEHAAISV